MIPEIIAGASAAAAGLAVVFHGVFASRSSLWGPLLWRGDAAAPARVALTFDDGPHPEATPRTLDLLGKAGVRATFFLVGKEAEKWPAIVKRIVDEGHLIGNHSWAHSRTGGYRFTPYWEREITRTANLLEEISGARPAWFRPPFAVKQWHMHRAVRRLSNTMISFTLRALDGFATTPEKIVERLVPHAAAGSILALHDGSVARDDRPIEPTLLALPRVIDGLRSRGLSVVPMDDLIAAPPYAPPVKPASALSPARVVNS